VPCQGGAAHFINMAARNRPRAGALKDDIDEERSLWNAIRADGRRLDQLMVSLNFLQDNRENYSESAHGGRLQTPANIVSCTGPKGEHLCSIKIRSPSSDQYEVFILPTTFFDRVLHQQATAS